MKAIEDTITRVIRTIDYGRTPARRDRKESQELRAKVRRVLARCVQEAFKEVINADDRKS